VVNFIADIQHEITGFRIENNLSLMGLKTTSL
jgi:hypothetical protein